MAELDGKVALVTGSSRGIGRAIALRLANAGADVAIHGSAPGGRSKEAGDAVCAEIEALGRRAVYVGGDVSDKEAVGTFVSAAAETLGGLDILVLNAARAPFKETARLLERDLRQLVDTNLLGNVFCVQKALPHLAAGGGRIVFVSSLGSRFMNPRYPLGPMKAAMEAWVRQWSEELASKDVHANAVCAGLVKTDAWKTLRRLWRGLERLPDERFVLPEEVADAVAFLAGPGSTAVRGQTLVVDRGLSNRLFGDG
jgi:NAD(P)-dependent dehydrogenase (short-subunit alcohol dehydrogenase family)